jgi:hypothetical protein
MLVSDPAPRPAYEHLENRIGLDRFMG